MEEILNKLLGILREELEVYGNLLEVAGEKREILVEGDVERLVELTSREEKLIGRVDELEDERMEYLKRIGDDLGLEPDQLSYSRLFAEVDSGERESFARVRDELLETIGDLQEKNQQNETLLQESLSYGEFLFDLLAELEKSGVTYSSDGSSGGEGNSLVDGRA